ncbi:MAG: hypothetical protein QOH59_1088, partial [Gemmatimonadales bacterium]|nr:hypothetical protein [Gemmatimonadales bacterium]
QALTVGGAGNTTVSGVIGTTSGTLTKDGTGTLALSAANTYTGVTTVSAGALEVRNNTALGTTAGATTVAAGAALEVDGSGLLIAEPLTLNGTGVAAAGSLRNLANANTWSGAITLATASRINSDAGTLTVSNTISGATRALTVGGAGNTTVSGVIATTTGTLTKDGTGTLTLSANNTYTGLTTAGAGTLVVNGVQAASAVSLNGGTLGGTGTVGAITSAALGGTVSPGQGPGILNSGNLNLSIGSPSFLVELNGTTAGTGYDRLNVTGSVNLGGATLTATVGFATSNGMTFTVIANDGADAVTGTFAGLAEGSTVVLSGLGFTISYVGGTGNDVVLSRAAPTLVLGSSVLPAGTAPPGTDLTYTLTFTNAGGSAAHTLVLTDSVSINADFKLGSLASSLGSTGLTVIVAYSSDGGSTWTYTPSSGAGGAPAGYDRLVTHLLWTFTGTLPHMVPDNTGSVGFVARIR